MRLGPQLVPEWPKLAWVASLPIAAGEVKILHGPMVETADDWIVEAVWAGDFAKGDFDLTDLGFGTGVRCRQNAVTFVSSGSTLDRLVYCERNGQWFVSNSLGALLAVTGLELCDDYDYSQNLKSICRGLGDYVRSLPASSGSVNLVYFNNLLWNGREMQEVDKPDDAPTLDGYQSYRQFLDKSLRLLAANARAPERHWPVEFLTTISTGYDSAAVAALVRQIGCRNAVTFRQSRSLWRGSDSGRHIASALGLACQEYDRAAREYPHEESLWAMVGRPGVLNWTLFDYPEPLCCFFTGCHGDKVWERDRSPLTDPFQIPSLGDLGIGEFRLLKGIFHCPVPHWGMRHVHDIRAISFLDEMAPWTLGVTGYDRPIPRRIVEEAGVPRRMFGILKKNTSHESVMLWPYSAQAQRSFAAFRSERGHRSPSRLGAAVARWLCTAETLAVRNLLGKLGIDTRARDQLRPDGEYLLFQWGNHELRRAYARALRASGGLDDRALAVPDRERSASRPRLPTASGLIDVRGPWRSQRASAEWGLPPAAT